MTSTSTLSRSIGQAPSQQRLAEKVTILNQRLVGLLTRLHNAKQILSLPRTRPFFMMEKSFDPAIKVLMKKFPNTDIRANSSSLSMLAERRDEIMGKLQLHYFTLVDILEVKDNICELLTRMDAYGVHLDIELNFDLTRGYLDLVANYVSLMILLSRVDDRKLLIALFNFAHELKHGCGEKTFPRLAQILTEFDPPMRKLCDEFVPHNRVLTSALLSLECICSRRFYRAESWRSGSVFSVLAKPETLTNALFSDTLALEILSQDALERWIVFGFMVIHPTLNNEKGLALWKLALNSSYVLPLFRDEVIHTHPFIMAFFDTIRNYNKRVNEVREWYGQVCSLALEMRKDRRKYLRGMLRESLLVYTDKPGLLGPKVLYVFMLLCYTRDEIHWLIRHAANPPVKPGGGGKARINAQDFVDRFLPELLFHHEELRDLVRKYAQVIQRYHVQYLKSWDVVEVQVDLSQVELPEDEAMILSAIIQELSQLHVQQVHSDKEIFDLRGVRLDWFRLQAYMSVNGHPKPLKDSPKLAKHMNTLSFHTSCVDALDEIMFNTSDLSLLFFYPNLLQEYFKQNIEFPAQHRFIIVFPLLCRHFMEACHPLCPEERVLVGETAFKMALDFLRQITLEITQLVTCMCDEHSRLAYRLLPRFAVPLLVEEARAQAAEQAAVEGNKKTVKKLARGTVEARAGLQAVLDQLPGCESIRRCREDATKLDKLHMAMTELCYTINHSSRIKVWERELVPRELFVAELEQRFCKMIVSSQMYRPEEAPEEIAKPSELLDCIRTSMCVLQDLEKYLQIDVPRIFSNVLLQHTQPGDSFQGQPTVTYNYTIWYMEVLMAAACNDQVIHSPRLKSFITEFRSPTSGGGSGNQGVEGLRYRAEEFADLNELRALAELIGPYGVKYLTERIMAQVATCYEGIKKNVLENSQILESMRYAFADPERMESLAVNLRDADRLLPSLKQIGVLLAFRELLAEALLDTVQRRIPFLLAASDQLIEVRRREASCSLNPNSALQEHLIISELGSAMGRLTQPDAILCHALRSKDPLKSEEEYKIACHLLVYVAIMLPRLARLDATIYRHEHEGHADNSHCLAPAIAALFNTLFSMHFREEAEVDKRWKEFLALTSSALLRMARESPTPRNRDSVFILFNMIISRCHTLTMDLLESCFPYALLRNAYHNVNTRGDAATTAKTGGGGNNLGVATSAGSSVNSTAVRR